MTARFIRLTALWIAAVIPLLVCTPSLDAYELPKALALHLGAAALWLAAARSGLPLCPTPIIPPLAAFLTLGLVATAASRLPLTGLFGEYTSYQGWAHWAAAAALLVALPGGLRRTSDVDRLRAAATVSLTIAAGYALIQLILPRADGEPLPRVWGTAGNAYFLGTLLALGVPLAAGQAADTRSASRRWWWIAAGAMILAGVLSSGSRSALAAAVLGGAVVAGRRGRQVWQPVLVVGGLTLATCGVLLPADRNPFPPLIERMTDLVHGRDARGAIWVMAGRLVRDRPLTGHGPDSFATQAGGVQTPALWERLWRGSPEKAHNELLQLAATVGIPGLGAAVWLLVILVRAAGAGIRAGPGLSTAAALAGLAFTGMFGFITLSPLAIALPLAAWPLVRLPARPVPAPVARAVATVLLLSTLALSRFLAADAQARAVIASGSVRVNPVLHPALPFANRLLRAGDLLERHWLGPTVGPGQSGRAGQEQLQSLTALYEGARALNPLHPLAHSSLARLAAREGRLQDADAGYRQARALAPHDAYLILEHGQVLLAAGREAEGLAALTAATTDYPAFAEPVGMAGYAHLKAGRTAEAERLLALSITLDWHGNAAAAYAAAMNLATLYHRSGRESDAQRTAALAESWRMQIKP